jgi:drug/metabolite transporter (DMT)-like permease
VTPEDGVARATSATPPPALFRTREGNPARRPEAGYGLALGAAVCFALSASVAARLLRTESSPWDLAQIRIFGSCAVLAVLAALRPRSVALPRRVWGHVVLFGLVALLATQATFYAALQHIPVAVASLLQLVGPMTVTVLGLAAAGRTPRAVWLACGAAFAGLYLVSGAYRFGLLRQDATGIALALGSAACFAGYFVFGDRLAGWPARTVLTWGYAVAAGGWIVLDLLWRRPPELPETGIRRFDLVILVLVGTLIPTLLNTAALRRLGAAAGALTTVATPPLSGLVAWIALDERLAVPRIVGGVMTLTALAWIEMRDIRAARSSRRG